MTITQKTSLFTPNEYLRQEEAATTKREYRMANHGPHYPIRSGLHRPTTA